MKANSQYDTILAYLQALCLQGCTYEVRIPKISKGGYKLTAAGYFDDLRAMATAIAQWDARSEYKVDAVYCTLNPVNPDLAARAYNRMQEKPDL
jgi:hypothetical protein